VFEEYFICILERSSFHKKMWRGFSKIFTSFIGVVIVAPQVSMEILLCVLSVLVFHRSDSKASTTVILQYVNLKPHCTFVIQ